MGNFFLQKGENLILHDKLNPEAACSIYLSIVFDLLGPGQQHYDSVL